MKRTMTAVAAAFVLAACGAGGQPQIPPTPEGAQAPVELVGGPGPTQQSQPLTDQERAQFEGRVREYMDRYQEEFASGFEQTAAFPEQMVGMQPNTDHRWYVNLVGGTTYRFIGGCDDDCSNIDFELIAPGGGVVASDLLPDDYPVAEFTPPANGRYIARVIMRTCTVAPCFTGARVLTPSAGGAPGPVEPIAGESPQNEATPAQGQTPSDK